MRNELQKQTLLKELLKHYYNSNTKIYAGNEFCNTKKLKALERPDLIIIGQPKTNYQFKDKRNIGSTVGIEMKDTVSLNDTKTGIVQTQKYKNQEYLIRETKQKIELDTVAYTTTRSVKEGILCENPEYNVTLERIAWKFDVPILINHNNCLFWSYRNKYFHLDGRIYGRFGKDAIFYKY